MVRFILAAYLTRFNRLLSIERWAIPNTQGNDRLFSTPWTTDRKLKLPAAIPATSTIFYAGQAAGRDANGNFSQMDDTAPKEFIGIVQDLVRTQVDPIDTVQSNGLLGDKMFMIEQPLQFTALIAAAAAGDEGRKVYWQFNTTVQYSPGNFGNLAGMVWHVKDPTHIVVTPPWMLADLLGSKANQILSGTAPIINLTKFDLGKTFQVPSTIAQTINLPQSSKCGSGDQLIFFQTGTVGAQVTFASAFGDTFNSLAGLAASTLLFGTVSGSRMTLQTDGLGKWWQVG